MTTKPSFVHSRVAGEAASRSSVECHWSDDKCHRPQIVRTYVLMDLKFYMWHEIICVNPRSAVRCF